MTFLQWLAGMAVLFAVIGLIALLALWVDHWHVRHTDNWRAKRQLKDPPDDEGSGAVRLVFELLSAVFVVTGLLVCIYGESKLLRAVAGIALVVVVSAVTISLNTHFAEDEEV